MDDVYTTAKWANRMLRPLTSLHHRLGKYREMQSIDAQEPAIIPKPVSSTSTSELSSKRNNNNSNTAGDTEDDSDCGSNDPSWIPRKPDAKRVKHKYVAKGERMRGRARFRSVLDSPETVKTLPGAIEIATPLITGKTADVKTRFGDRQEARGSTKGAANLAEHEGWTEKPGKRQKQARFPKPDPQWRVSLDSAKDINYVDIVQRLDILFLKFLEKTRLADSRSPRSTSGSRSLLLTVMRRLPQFIAREQKLQDELDGDDDMDMADAYFTELESAYGSSGKGWQPLREAVRSQGIFLVCNMLQENWITHLTASSLIYKCIGAEENDAAERLLSALLSKLDHYDFPDSFDPWRLHQYARDPLRLLHKYWTASGNNVFVFGEIERLLQRKVLPAEWMVTTPWKGFVASATTSLSNGDHDYAAATKLITTILETAADVQSDQRYTDTYNKHAKMAKGRQVRATPKAQPHDPRLNQNRCPIYIHDALSNLTSSLVVALCSMYYVRMEQPRNLDIDSSARIASIFSGMALSLQRELAVKRRKLKDDQVKAHILRKGYILLGHYLLRCQQNTQISDCDKVEIVDVILSKDCEPFFELLEQNMDIVKELSAMVGQIVRCCERGGEHAQCRRARRLCEQMLAFEQFGMDNLTLFLGQVAIEVALDFAQYSQDVEDHTFAAEIQETVSACRVHLRGNGNRKSKLGNHDSAPVYRWEEGIGEWIAKTPKSAMPRPMIEAAIRARSLSSVSEDEASCSPSSIRHGSSMTSAESPSSVSLKRKDVDVDSPPRRIKRPRRSYDKTRQSERIAAKQSNVLVVIHNNKRQNHVPSYHCPRDSESDYDSLENTSESDEASEDHFQTETRETSDDEEGDAKATELQGTGSAAQQNRKRVGFEVIIHNYAASRNPASGLQQQQRGSGRPRKQVVQQPVGLRTRVPPRQGLSQQRSVIPCSEDEEEDSDDELSFLM